MCSLVALRTPPEVFRELAPVLLDASGKLLLERAHLRLPGRSAHVGLERGAPHRGGPILGSVIGAILGVKAMSD